MTQRINPKPALLACLVCCSVAFLSGCASTPPSPENSSSLQQDTSLHSLRISEQTPSGTGKQASPLDKIEIAEQPPIARTIDLTDEPDDLFQRLRHGFSMPDINDDLVLYHQQWYLNRPDYLRRMVDRSSRYLHHIVEELDKRGMPMELALLPMVESAYNPMAYSRAKASGLWQFIPSTGKRYNLDQNWWKDERRDIVASTIAALDYLQSIYELHGDWHLALASYNWGEGAVGRAFAKNRAQGLPTDYLNLTMPQETRNYVPKLQALKNIFRSWTLLVQLDLPQVPNRPFFATVTTDSHIDVKVAATLAEMPVQEFIALNPAHNRPVIKSDSELVIPAEKLDTFVSNLEAHAENNKPLSAWQSHTLRRGESLTTVARRFGMSVANLKAINGIKGKTRVGPGHTLLVAGQGGKTDLSALPEQPRQADSSPEPQGKTRVHTIRRGESLLGIARHYGTTTAELKRINRLKSNALVAGARLQVPASADTAAGSRNTEASNTAKSVARNAGTPARKVSMNKPAGKPAKVTRHVVRSGDTLYSIAKQYKVDTDDLMRWNKVSPNNLKPGKTLLIQFAANP